MRSNKENREQEKGGVASLRRWLDKSSTGYSASFLKMPKGAAMFQPKAGVMLLDIIPYIVGKGNPNADEGAIYMERTFFTHPRIGANQSAYLCPARSSNEPCPICEFRAKHWTQDVDPEEEKLLKSLLPKQRQLFNVIDLKNPDKGIQIWDMSFFNFGQKLQEEIQMADEDSGWDIFYHWSKGFTLKIGFVEESMGKGRPYLRAGTIHFRERREQYEKSITEEAHCLDDLLIEPDYDELKDTFLQTMRKSKEADEDDDEPPKKKSKKDEDDDVPMEDDDPAPKKRKSSDDEDEDPPRKKKPVDDVDDPPRKRKSSDDDDDDPPKKKKSADWDDFDEDPPKKKSKKDEDEDDDEPPKKRKSSDDEDEDEDPPKKKSKKDEDDDGGWDEPAPKKKSKKDEDED